jgi:trimethylamine--corrinoid protein Co-methyltransferase
VPPELHPLYSFFALAHETDKHLGGPGLDHPWQAAVLQRMAKAVVGGRSTAAGFVLDMGFSPVSPLHLGAGMCEGLIDGARLGMAVMPLPAPVAGTTAPASLAGAVAQQDAEVLAGVVLVQAAAPGTACLYGARLAIGDPRTGRLLGAAGAAAVASVGATLLARRHGLACDCYGPETSSHLFDLQAGYQMAVPTVVGALGRPRFMSGIGAWGDTTTCLESLVIGDTLYRAALAALEPPEWQGDALDPDALAEGVLAPGGFLATRHTRRWIRRNVPPDELSVQAGFEEWVQRGRPDLLERASERAAELMRREPVGLPQDVSDELRRLVLDAAAEHGVAAPDPFTLRERLHG